MRTKAVLAVPLGLLLALSAFAEEAPRTESAKLTGTWLATSITHDGKESPADEVKKVLLIVKGENYTFVEGGTVIKGTHKLDGSKTPKTIDAKRTSGPGKGDLLKGIYELDATTFKVCFAAAGKARPTAFDAKAGTENRLLILKRSKSKKR